MIWKWIKHGKRFIEKCRRDHISAFAAQTAFFLLLSLIPFLMLFSSLLKYTVVSEATLLSLVNEFMPSYIAPFVISIINEVYHKSVGIVSVSAVVAIWSAAQGVQHMAAGLNEINGVEETRNWLVRRFWAVVYTAVFLVAVVAALALWVFGNAIQDILAEYVPFVVAAIEWFFNLRELIMFGIISCLFTIIFKTLPNNKEIKTHRLTLRNQLPGAVLGTAFWYLFSVGISIYVGYFNGFSMYGSLTTIALVMLWIYFGVYIMMLCAEMNLMFMELNITNKGVG